MYKPNNESGSEWMIFHKNSYIIVVGVTEYESEVKVQKFEMVDRKWLSHILESAKIYKISFDSGI